MAKFQNTDKWRRPELFFSDILTKGSRQDYVTRDENLVVFYRALVVAVDIDGGQLENPNGDGGVKHKIGKQEINIPAIEGPKNPRNSIKARIITDGFDQFSDDESLKIFWPFFPENDALPIKPGEHVYVIFEDREFEHGLWLGKVSGHEGLNYYRGENSFEESNSQKLSSLYGDSPPNNEEEKNTDVFAGEHFISKNKNSLFTGDE